VRFILFLKFLTQEMGFSFFFLSSFFVFFFSPLWGFNTNGLHLYYILAWLLSLRACMFFCIESTERNASRHGRGNRLLPPSLSNLDSIHLGRNERERKR
jgi:hypothetical protein